MRLNIKKRLKRLVCFLLYKFTYLNLKFYCFVGLKLIIDFHRIEFYYIRVNKL